MKGTVKSKSDVERLFRKGRRSSSYLMTVIAAATPEKSSLEGRCAFIAGKKLGVAPFRSRCKRVLRESARELGAPWCGYDVVFTARYKLARAPYEDVVRTMRRQLKELGIVK